MSHSSPDLRRARPLLFTASTVQKYAYLTISKRFKSRLKNCVTHSFSCAYRISNRYKTAVFKMWFLSAKTGRTSQDADEIWGRRAKPSGRRRNQEPKAKRRQLRAGIERSIPETRRRSPKEAKAAQLPDKRHRDAHAAKPGRYEGKGEHAHRKGGRYIGVKLDLAAATKTLSSWGLQVQTPHPGPTVKVAAT